MSPPGGRRPPHFIIIIRTGARRGIYKSPAQQIIALLLGAGRGVSALPQSGVHSDILHSITLAGDKKETRSFLSPSGYAD